MIMQPKFSNIFKYIFSAFCAQSDCDRESAEEFYATCTNLEDNKIALHRAIAIYEKKCKIYKNSIDRNRAEVYILFRMIGMVSAK
jgi:hypothetical protein